MPQETVAAGAPGSALMGSASSLTGGFSQAMPSMLDPGPLLESALNPKLDLTKSFFSFVSLVIV